MAKNYYKKPIKKYMVCAFLNGYNIFYLTKCQKLCLLVISKVSKGIK